MEGVTEAAMYHSKALYSNTVMKTGPYSKNVTEYTSRIKITTSQNVLVQACIGAVSCHFQDWQWHTFLTFRHHASCI